MESSNFVWDGRAARYRWKKNGQFLSRDRVNGLVRGRVESARSQLVGLYDQLKSGDINFRQFQSQGRDLIRNIHSQGLMLGAGGYDQVPSEDFLELGRFLRNEEYPRWRKFMSEIADGRLSEKQIKARLGMYAGHGRRSVGKGEEIATKKAGFQYERRKLGSCSPHCVDCRLYASQGIQVIGTLPVPADRCRCAGYCCCSKVYYRTLEEAVKG